MSSKVKFECIIDECEDVCCVSKYIPVTDVDMKRLLELGNNLLSMIMIKEGIEGLPTLYGNKRSGVLALRRRYDRCIFLEEGRCSIYDVRPMACRMYPLNPILNRKGGKYKLRIEICKECSGIGCGMEMDDNETRDLIEQWVKERSAYEKRVREWNTRKDRDIAEFIRRCLK